MPVKRSRKSAVRRKVTPEKAVCSQIENYLTAHRIRYFSNEVYSGPTKSGAWLKVGEKGMSDYSAFVPVCNPIKPGTKLYPDYFRILHIEVKAAKGSQRLEQKVWQQMEEADGRYYIIAKDYTDVERWLHEKGCL